MFFMICLSTSAISLAGLILSFRYGITSLGPGPTRDRAVQSQQVWLGLDDVVDVDDLGLTGQFDPDLTQNRHQALTERVELLS
jgi:hypothetical protein